MKNFFALLSILFIAIGAQAQAPRMFNYQAVARDQNNQPYANTSLRIRFAVIEGSANGTVRYSEEHTVTTSALGVFEAAIGDGTVLQGNMNNVTLGDDNYFLRVELNPQASGGSFIPMGTTQLLSVPYALYAAESGSSANQTLSLSGNELTISDGNTVQLPEYLAGAGITISGQTISAKDVSATNEIQSLQLSGNELSISSGNSVILPAGGGLSLPYSGTQSNTATLFTVINSGTGGAIHGITNGGGEAAVIGEDPTGGLAGVRGYSSSSYGVLGYSDTGWGMLGQSPGGVGIRGEGGIGVEGNGAGEGCHFSGDIYGGIFEGGSQSALFALGNPANYAGIFQGRFYATTLEKGSGSFKIDHPLDPENKYLYHSFVESPDMMNVYNGNVTTDGNGLATVTLPDYFEALNRDFRYQLTTIGTFAQVMVEREVSENTFTIRSDKPNVKVSWQVTGIRQDAHANQFRIVPTVDKAEKDKGKFLCPECFHQPEEKGIFYYQKHLYDSPPK